VLIRYIETSGTALLVIWTKFGKRKIKGILDICVDETAALTIEQRTQGTIYIPSGIEINQRELGRGGEWGK